MPVCDNAKNLRKDYCVLKPAIYSNGKRQWRVIVIKKKKEKKKVMHPHKPVTSLDKCRDRVTIFFRKSNGGNDVYLWYGFT